MLWNAKKDLIKRSITNTDLKTFDFLQLLLIRFRIFVPFDLGIEKAFLGGKEYSHKSSNETSEVTEQISYDRRPSSSGASGADSLRPTYFFLPSLLGPGEPIEIWTYKNAEAWKTTLCHSVLFPDGVPPGLMERITATVLSNLYAIHKHDPDDIRDADSNKGTKRQCYEGDIRVREVLCWRNAFFLKLSMTSEAPNGKDKISFVEIFAVLADKDSNYCVGSEGMSIGSSRFVLSGKGSIGGGGRKIWLGGYLVVLEAVFGVMEEYCGLEFEMQGVCQTCLASKNISDAKCWSRETVSRAINDGATMIRCDHGHNVDISFVCPRYFLDNQNNGTKFKNEHDNNGGINHDWLRAVVVVGLWCKRRRQITAVGSGFIADKKEGLIVTASHTLMKIGGGKIFGMNYFGNKDGTIVIGVIPKSGTNGTVSEAEFRYFAEIVVKDPMKDGIFHVDACILRITTKMENGVRGNGEGCGDQSQTVLKHNKERLKKQRFARLKITEKFERAQKIYMIGYNQDSFPDSVNRSIDCYTGNIASVVTCDRNDNKSQVHPHGERFQPYKEIVVNCDTISGHSGGPCINQDGEVVGILSRADAFERKRCYFVPSTEWLPLLKKAQNNPTVRGLF